MSAQLLENWGQRLLVCCMCVCLFNHISPCEGPFVLLVVSYVFMSAQLEENWGQRPLVCCMCAASQQLCLVPLLFHAPAKDLGFLILSFPLNGG